MRITVKGKEEKETSRKRTPRIMRGGRRAAWTLAVSLVFASFAGSAQEADTASYLPLPDVPASLRTPASRAAYIVTRFWDGMDFADTLRSHDRDFMERNFANYLSLFPVADTSVLAGAVGGLVGRARTDADGLSLLMELAGKYLCEPESPVFNESYYLLFADAFMEIPSGRYDERMRVQAQREAVRKNRVGTVAADFAYETPDGRRYRMRETAKGKKLLLLFYDPDCTHCRETIAELGGMEALRRAVLTGRAAVLAVYSAFDDRQSWRRTLGMLPEEWTAGYDNGTVYTEDLYVLRRMPSVYLLDAERRVIAKDPPAEHLSLLLGGAAE